MITRRQALQLFCATGAALAAGRRARASTWNGYGDAVVIDALAGPGEDGGDPMAPLSAKAVANAKASGVTAVNLTIGVGDSWEETIAGIARAERTLDEHPDVFVKVKRAADLKACKATQRCGLIYGTQDLAMMGEDLSRLEVLHHLGVRVIQPTYNLRNLVGDGCLEPRNAGLSKLGHEALARLDQLRIVTDLSHCGQRTTAEAIARAKGPSAMTHTGCAAVFAHPRNKRDQELRACAERGGVVGIYFMPYLRAAGQPHAEDVVRHLEHAVQVCGEDHVGIGSDGSLSPVVLDDKYRELFAASIERRKKAGISAPGEEPDAFLFAPELNTPRRLETLGGLLLARGHSEARVAKILGGNFARLFGEVWG